MKKEIETTLVVVRDDPLGVMEEIAALRSLGPYRLSPPVMLSLKDTYYDTPSRLLSTRGIAVRTRESGTSVLFCIKQDERIDESGAAFRDEFEMPWSRQCFDHIAHILHKLARCVGEVPARTDSPGECLVCLGLTAIQERETARLAKNAEATDGPDRGVLAEVALDRVCYHLSGFRILHYEIEVEATSPDLIDPVRDLTALLRQRYGGCLMPWRHNKLVTGLALEQLIAEGRLSVHPGRFTCLAGTDYMAIETVLKDF
ncbi:MAG: CYTH domain-containing protein [Desulfobacterota bacterium]|jgi:hypothetical protein|nr:CYTH domain-containing protein [Thermodesulfobacteriota bacterium]